MLCVQMWGLKKEWAANCEILQGFQTVSLDSSFQECYSDGTWKGK